MSTSPAQTTPAPVLLSARAPSPAVRAGSDSAHCEVAASAAVAGPARLVLLLAIAGGCLTGLAGVFDDHAAPGWTRWPIIGLVSLALLALLRWERAGPVLVRHPSPLFAFLIAALWLLPTVGESSPFLFLILAACLLAGSLYDWRGQLLFAVVGVLGYALALTARVGRVPVSATFQVVAGNPALLVLSLLAGAALRRLLERQSASDARLQQTLQLAAAADERARIARELHDSVTKTLHGIALAAQALQSWAVRDPAAVPSRAALLAQAAEVGAQQARDLVGTLRVGATDGPLSLSVVAACERWRTETGADVSVTADEACVLPAAGRHELLSVLAEALDNAAKHGRADEVSVELMAAGPEVVLRVRDDGCGLPEALDLDGLAAASHYGIAGMRERARRVGGQLHVQRTSTEGGTTVLLTLPGAMTMGAGSAA